MSQYPVESNEQLYQAVNYLLSGPGGLGQNFAGYSTYAQGYSTGNFRPPFTNTAGANLFVAPIPLGVSEMLDERTWKFNFASPEVTPPFVPGQPITVLGVADSYYDGDYEPIGVVECTTTYVIARTDGYFDIEPPSSGGDVYFYNTFRSGSEATLSTDANGKVTITGATDRVFLSAQLNNVISYINASSTNFRYTVRINRLKGFVTSDPINPEYRFIPDATIAERVYEYTLTGSGSLDDVETIFTAIIDEPEIGYYWYILEVQYKNLDWDGTGSLPAFQVTDAVFTQRGLSAQVVKE